jgi:hypothetical protein
MLALEGRRGSRHHLRHGSGCRWGQGGRRRSHKHLRHKFGCRQGQGGRWRYIGEVVAAFVTDLAGAGAVSLHPLPSSSTGPNPIAMVEEAVNLAAAATPSLPPRVGTGGVPQGDATFTRLGDNGGAAPPGGTVTSLPHAGAGR